MSSVTDAPENPLPLGRSRSRSTGGGRAIRWLRANLFASIPSTVISLLLIFLLGKACVSLVLWGYWNAIWTFPTTRPAPAGRSAGLAPAGRSPEKYRSSCSVRIHSISSGGRRWRP